MTRASGLLLHPTSLPGRFGIGDLGATAYEFLEFLSASGQRLWQVLPLGPTGYGDSPYACFSAFAGNPLLISLDRLAESGFLLQDDLHDIPAFPERMVDYGRVVEWKGHLLDQAFTRFKTEASAAEQDEFEQFCEMNRVWLDDYALFMALKAAHGGAAWTTWPPEIAGRQPHAVAEWTERLADRIMFHRYVQYLFNAQWSAVRQYAHDLGIELVGDVPIFAAHDSADVWSHPDLFYLDESGSPTVVAGVPPDYFSKTGQLWGNPLYRWDELARTGYAWWIARLRATFALVDRVRLDHFRGFEAYWEVPATEETAINGRWIPGPGADFFEAVRQALGPVPIIAEDLGVITPEVEALRDQFGFPGMKVLQFAFGADATNPYLPHNYFRNCVVYTGTHDNDTTLGWYWESGTPAEQAAVLKYVGTDDRDLHWSMIRLAFAAVADTAVVPLQDVLGLGTEARMNRPGTSSGNWTWRYPAGVLTRGVARRLYELTDVYGRLNNTPPQHDIGQP